MELTEGQVWVHCNKEDNGYDKYLVIDYVTNSCFNCRETPFGKVTSFAYYRDAYLLDDECWELIDSEKLCELLCSYNKCISVIHEQVAYERQLISKREFAEQEVKEKERICESMQARLTQVANELDVEREKRTHVEKRNCELEEKLEEIERELANTKNDYLVLVAVLEGFNGNVENLQKCLVELFQNFVSKLVESDKNDRR